MGRQLQMLIAATLGVTTVWMANGSLVPRPRQEFSPGQFYAVEVRDSVAHLELQAAQDSQTYEIVIGCLGDAADEYPVTLEPLPQIEWPSRVARVPVRFDKPDVKCPLPPYAQPDEHDKEPLLERSFFLHVTDGGLDDPRHYTEVTARLLTDGAHVRVYGDTQLRAGRRVRQLAREVADYFDDELHSAVAGLLGGYRDIDGDGKFLVLISPWLDRLQGGRTSLGGFVRGSDFRTDLETPFSNRCDMLYLNSRLTPGPHLRTILTHEYAHAVCFSRRLPSEQHPDGFPLEEDWLNEAISHVAESQIPNGWSNLDYRVAEYLASPQRFPLVVPDYFNAGLWRNHGCRGATFLFLQWCAAQYGDEILRSLVNAPAQGPDNIASATDVPFSLLFRQWTMSLLSPRREEGTAFGGVRLHGEFGRESLNGPQVQEWSGDAPLTLNLRGTAVGFVRFNVKRQSAPVALRIRSMPAARLQVTLRSVDR